MADPRHRLGTRKEKQALGFLLTHGLTLLQRNFRTRFGEIDLVMLDRDCVVFIEVRYRGARDLCSAAESVDGRKRRRLMLAAACYLRRHASMAEKPARFDVVAIDGVSPGRDRIRWLRDAFRPGD